MLDEALDSAKAGVCVKDRDGRVLQQNDICRDICGLREGTVCSDGCMLLHAGDSTRQWKNWGTSVYRNSAMHGGHYDVALICSDERIVTFLQPLDDVYEHALAHYRDKGLTRRELQILKLLYDGQSNQAIAQTLSLSPKTVDKHRENIMRKMEVNSLAQLFKAVHAKGLLLASGSEGISQVL